MAQGIGGNTRTITIDSTWNDVNLYFQMWVFGGQNGVQYQEVNLIKSYNVNNP